MAEGLQGLEGIGVNIDTSQLIQGAGTFAAIVVGIGLGLLTFLVVRYYVRFNKKVILQVQSGDGRRAMEDKGRLDMKKREFKLLKNPNLICQYPTSNNILPFGKGEMLFGYVANGSCSWMDITANRNFVLPDVNMMNFMVDTYARIDEATKLMPKFWDKYGKDILWISTIAIFLVAIVLILRSVDNAIKMAGDVAGSVTQAKINQVAQQVGLPILALFSLRDRK